jgi:hypothetical protein
MIAEPTTMVELGGEKRQLYFNANTMCAYEEATGKFFLDTVSRLYDVLRENVPQLQKAVNDGTSVIEMPKDPTEAAARNRKISGAILRKVPMTDLRALIWAACHKYQNDEPVWPLTLHQVGRLITPLAVPRLFLAFITGQVSNAPTPQEMGESQPPQKEPQAEASGAPQKNGGELSTALLEDALG